MNQRKGPAEAGPDQWADDLGAQALRRRAPHMVTGPKPVGSRAPGAGLGTTFLAIWHSSQIQSGHIILLGP